MPRKSRIDTPGALHHIIARGIEGRIIFADDKDRYAFLSRLGNILEQSQTVCYAWALIPNHFHLLLRTGSDPVATVMRRLLTGHAVSFNRRHKRQGHLFQNRYKSILCQEDTYFLELIRYIHLNPLRAGLVRDLGQLDKYPFGGHAALMSDSGPTWQDRKKVLSLFDTRISAARRQYKAYIAKGEAQGRRPDLTGGGLIRSAGGWEAVKSLRNNNIHLKSDERILGDSEFVCQTLSKADEAFERRYALAARGVDIDYIAEKVAGLLRMPVEEVWREGKYRNLVIARSLLCFWAVRELGTSMAWLSRKFNVSIAAVSRSVRRGSEIAGKKGYELD